MPKDPIPMVFLKSLMLLLGTSQSSSSLETFFVLIAVGSSAVNALVLAGDVGDDVGVRVDAGEEETDCEDFDGLLLLLLPGYSSSSDTMS